MWVSLRCRRSPWGRWRWAAWCSWRSTSWLSPTVSEPLHSNWNDVSWRNPKDICVPWEFLYLGCCSGLRLEPFNNRLSLGVIRNAHGLKHAQLFRVKLFTVLKRECCFWHHRFFFSSPDHKFTCVETVKYKFDSGTWYVQCVWLRFCSHHTCPLLTDCKPSSSSQTSGPSHWLQQLRNHKCVLKAVQLCHQVLTWISGSRTQNPSALRQSKAGHLDNPPWHLIIGVCFCAKHLLWVASVSAVSGHAVQMKPKR